jgi:ABC-2 type transport system permease protein
MKQITALIIKELRIVARDRTALLLMFAAPVALALVMAFAFGGIGKNAGLGQISFNVVNQDGGEIGARLVDVVNSGELASLLAPHVLTDTASSRAAVDADRVAASVTIPEGLTSCLQGSGGSCPDIILYANPGRIIGVGVVKGIIESFGQRAAAGSLAARIAITQLLTSGLVDPQHAQELLPKLASQAAEIAVNTVQLGIDVETGSAQENKPFDFLGYYVPATAILFLMFTLTTGSRSIHAERDSGTLVRLQAAPIHRSQLVIGKILSVVAVGLVQMGILVLFTRLVLGVHWGNPLGLVIHILLTVTAISALGLMIGGLAQTSSQADAIGGMVTMILAALGGNFVIRSSYPPFMRMLSLIGPNSWGITGFNKLAAGAPLSQLAPEYAALAGMSVLFTVFAVWGMRRVLR